MASAVSEVPAGRRPAPATLVPGQQLPAWGELPRPRLACFGDTRWEPVPIPGPEGSRGAERAPTWASPVAMTQEVATPNGVFWPHHPGAMPCRG